MKDKTQNIDPMASQNVAPVADKAVTADKTVDDKKAAKAASAKAWSEKKKAEAVDRRKKAAQIIEKLKTQGFWDKLNADEKQFFIDESVEHASTASLFTKIFGNTPKVGDKITLKDFMEKTFKGKSQLEYYINKRWAEKGIVIETTPADDPRNITYTIKALPSA